MQSVLCIVKRPSASSTRRNETRAALGKWVVLHDSERRGLPVNWFAETNYWVDGVRVEARPIR